MTMTSIEMDMLALMMCTPPVRCPACDDRGCFLCNYGRGY